eukprot:gene36571-biopygen10230
MDQHALHTDLEKRLIPQLIQLVLSPEGVYTSWKEAQPHIGGIRSGFKRFKIRQNAEAYVAQQVTLGQPPLSSQDAVFYTGRSASLASGSVGWGVYLTSAFVSPDSLWDPEVTAPSDPGWLLPKALSKAAVEHLAARGRSCSSSAVASLQSRIHRSRHRLVSSSSDPRRRSSRAPRILIRDPVCC